MPEALRIGVLSDTHGLLRPEAIAALAGSDHIIHAGDIGDESILATLRRLAPVTAVRGNVDREAWARVLPEVAEVELGGMRLCVVHIRGAAGYDPRETGVRALIYGHTHVPGMETRDDVLYLNPGSAGPRRFHLPVSLARILIRDGDLSATLIRLEGP
jgi:putative phosphoesterase